MKRGKYGLQPISLVVDDPRAVERRAELRLSHSWALVVGPALVNYTRLLRVRRGTLVMGCWKPELVPSLRKAAETVWPEIQARLERLLKLKLLKVEVLPCDPPPKEEPTPSVSLPVDAMAAVLRKLRDLRNQGWTGRGT
jgi:hypothetical protein